MTEGGKNWDFPLYPVIQSHGGCFRCRFTGPNPILGSQNHQAPAWASGKVAFSQVLHVMKDTSWRLGTTALFQKPNQSLIPNPSMSAKFPRPGETLQSFSLISWEGKFLRVFKVFWSFHESLCFPGVCLTQVCLGSPCSQLLREPLAPPRPWAPTGPSQWVIRPPPRGVCNILPQLLFGPPVAFFIYSPTMMPSSTYLHNYILKWKLWSPPSIKNQHHLPQMIRKWKSKAYFFFHWIPLLEKVSEFEVYSFWETSMRQVFKAG